MKPLACVRWALPLLAAGALSASGCQSAGATVEINTAAEFQSLVVNNPKPALVLFYKQGCASCLALMPTMDTLAQEYQGRATVGQFMIFTFVLAVTNQELKDRYNVELVPHVVLLVDGKERGHWTMEYDIDVYRQALDAALAAQRPPVRPAAPPARP